MALILLPVLMRPAIRTLLAIPYSNRVAVDLGGVFALATVVVFSADWGHQRAMWRALKGIRQRERREIVRLAESGKRMADSSHTTIVRRYAEAQLQWIDSWTYRVLFRILLPTWLPLSFAYPAAVNASYGHVGPAIGGAAFFLVCVVTLVYGARSNRRFRQTAAINGWSPVTELPLG